MDKIFFQLVHKIKNVLNLYKGLLYKRDSKIILFGAWFGEKFADNPKYLYLEALKHDEFNPVWITKNKDVYQELVKLGLPVALDDSRRGKWLQKKAKYYVICTGRNDIGTGTNYIGGSVIINLWHGIPLKKIVWADKYHSGSYPRYLFRKVIEYLPFRKEYIISTSTTMQNIYKYTFRKNKKHIPILGQPRNDLFFSDYFPESESVKKYKDKKIIAYMPTHRDEGRTFFDIEKLLDMEALESLCTKYDYYFLIKKHFYHREETFDDRKYNHIYDITNKNIDTQELLKFTDILITDYSSCYIDYLLLNRPIIYYAFDLDHYLATDREMYFNYEMVTAGPIVKTEEDLLIALEEAIINPDIQYEKRQKVRHVFYDDTACEMCGEKILEFMKELK